MAFPTSALFVPTFVDALDTTQLAVDLDLETHRGALYTNSLGTADLTTVAGYSASPFTANEVTGTGYTAGGALLTTTVFTHSAGGLCAFDAADTAWTSSTFSAVRGVLVYADALASNNGIAALNFGADFSVSSGTFTIQWNASGIFTIDFLP